MSGSDGKLLWGQEFQLVKWGLSEDQVVAFVTDLINQRDSLLDQQQHLLSLQKLAEKTVIEANELAENIKQEAQNEATRAAKETEEKIQEANELAENIKQEAQNEAARVAEEAEEKANEIKSEAQTQADKLLDEANEQAGSITREAQSEASRVTKDAEEKAHQITEEAQEQTEKIIAEANERAESIRQEAQEEATRIIGEAEEKTHTIAEEAQKKAEEESKEEATRILQGARQEAVTIIEASKRHVLNEVTDIKDRFLPHLENFVTEIRDIGDEMGQTMASVVEEEELETMAVDSPTPEVSDNGERDSSEVEADLESESKVEADLESESKVETDLESESEVEADLESEFATLVANNGHTEEETTEGESDGETMTLPPHLEDSDLHEGEIEIAVTPPVNIAQLIRVRRNLQEVSHLKILRTDGSWNGGSIITVLMDKPLPLVNILKGMPEIEKAEIFTGEAEADSDFLRGLAFESKSGSGPGQNIVVSLKGKLDS